MSGKARHPFLKICAYSVHPHMSFKPGTGQRSGDVGVTVTCGCEDCGVQPPQTFRFYVPRPFLQEMAEDLFAAANGVKPPSMMREVEGVH